MSDKTKIAKNTVFLYMRQLAVMFIAFFTSRIILGALGEVEYGVMSLVGGLAFSFGFFSTSLSNATQRFLCFAHGKDDRSELKEVFNAVALLFIMIGGIILIAGCAIGPLIIGLLKYPQQLTTAVYFIYFCTIISLAVTLTATMFDSVLISRENMKVYAYISILEVVGKLGIAYSLLLYSDCKLIWYAVATMCMTVLIKGSLIYFCFKHYPECHIRLHWDKAKIKEMGKFIGWNGIGTIVFALNEQGTNILLNLFFGPVVNAAKGIASQVNNAINHFSSNFLVALYPQMVKSYAAGERDKFMSLFYYSGKFGFALLWLLFLPIMLRRDYILHLWLGEVPGYTSVFLLWIIIYSIVSVFLTPQWYAVQSEGRIGKYMVVINIIFIMTLPVSWILLKYGFPPQIVYAVLVFDTIIRIATSIIIVKANIGLSIKRYISNILFPCVLTVCVTLPVCWYINSFIQRNFVGLIVNSAICVLFNVFFIGLILLTKHQRMTIFKTLRLRLSHVVDR